MDQLQDELSAIDAPESIARRLVTSIAVALQASLLVRHAPNVVADAFCASRIDGDWRGAFGTLPGSMDFDAIISRAAPIAH